MESLGGAKYPKIGHFGDISDVGLKSTKISREFHDDVVVT